MLVLHAKQLDNNYTCITYFALGSEAEEGLERFSIMKVPVSCRRRASDSIRLLWTASLSITTARCLDRRVMRLGHLSTLSREICCNYLLSFPVKSFLSSLCNPQFMHHHFTLRIWLVIYHSVIVGRIWNLR